MIAAALAMRTYTDKQIDPLLMWRAFHSERFVAQTIPFYSATELFNYLRVTYPNYAYNPSVASRVILDSDGLRRPPHPALPPCRIATLSQGREGIVKNLSGTGHSEANLGQLSIRSVPGSSTSCLTRARN
jgi:hypothetical protein